MKALLIYPKIPPSYWGANYALSFIDAKAAMPPLGLLTVAAMFPGDWELRLVDINVSPLTNEDILWADFVFLSSMVVQSESHANVIERCNRHGKPVISGGPYPTSYWQSITGVDHFFLGEAEVKFLTLLSDLKNGTARAVHREDAKVSMRQTPLPRYGLINVHDYASMAIQFSRGCPFKCEFCDIPNLFGQVPRTKTTEQMLSELQLLYDLGWHGSVFIVDDNFVGNVYEALRVLPGIAEWQRLHRHPFRLFTEASVNIGNKKRLLPAMRDAGFNMVFLGVESPNEEALKRAKKTQNIRRGVDPWEHLLGVVRNIQGHGIEVTAGFIIGLDGDTEFDGHVRFIQEAGIAVAMVGLLTVIKGSPLYPRLQKEGRLLGMTTGDNTGININFVPELPRERLIEDYIRTVETLYQPTLENYFERCLTLLKHLAPRRGQVRRIGKTEFRALLLSLWRQIHSPHRRAYMRFLYRVWMDHPRMLPEAFRHAIMGYHFEKLTRQTFSLERTLQHRRAA